MCFVPAASGGQPGHVWGVPLNLEVHTCAVHTYTSTPAQGSTRWQTSCPATLWSSLHRVFPWCHLQDQIKVGDTSAAIRQAWPWLSVSCRGDTCEHIINSMSIVDLGGTHLEKRILKKIFSFPSNQAMEIFFLFKIHNFGFLISCAFSLEWVSPFP